MFSNDPKWITSCFDGLNQSHSHLILRIQRILVITTETFLVWFCDGNHKNTQTL